jgi:Surface lipoprotein
MKKLLAGAIAVSLGACASTPGTTSTNDPYEDFNRTMFGFNAAVDKTVIEPVADGYTAVTPQWGRDRVSDFFQNLAEPLTFVNELLQGNGTGALQTGFRFTVNSTLGLAGLFDIAGYEGLPANKEDFGQTLAVWGVDSGPYLVLPFLGSTNPRDLLGFTVERAASPTNFARFSGNDEDDTVIKVGMAILNGVNTRSALDKQIESLRNQLEPYSALRDIHVRGRNAAIKNGQNDQTDNPELPDLPDF